MRAAAHRIATYPAQRLAAQKPLLSLVICTLDEAESIGNVLREVEAVLAHLPHETIVVDDSTSDATSDIVAAFALSFPSIRLIRRHGERGLASAALAGWDAARGECLAIMDGDGQHDPQILPGMLERLDADDAEIVVASRYAARGPSGLSGWRHAGSRAATLATFLMLGVKSSDPLSGCFIVRRDWYERARDRLSGVGFKILVDIMASGRRRPRLAEVETALRRRIGGQSKLDARIVVELFALLVEKRTRGLVPARFCLFAAIGSTGVVVHLSALGALVTHAHLPFWAAQALATLIAMTTNFFLNNALTFRDQRLAGHALWRGLLTFCLCCSGGAALSEITGSALQAIGSGWGLSGLAGAMSAAVLNFVSAKGATWRAPKGTAGEPAYVAPGGPATPLATPAE